MVAERILSLAGVSSNGENNSGKSLELLVVGDLEYTKYAEDTLGQVANGSTFLFNTQKSRYIPYEELSNLMSNSIQDKESINEPDVVLFDLRGKNYNRLQEVAKYLENNPNAYCVLTVDKNKETDFSNLNLWRELVKRKIKTPEGVIITNAIKRMHFENPKGIFTSGNGLESYFRTMLDDEKPLDPNYMGIVKQLKEGKWKVEICDPNAKLRRERFSRKDVSWTKYFSKLTTENGLSKLQREAMYNLSGGVDLDVITEVLRKTQPGKYKPYSPPQWGYPPTENLSTLNVKEILPLVRGFRDQPFTLYIHIPFCPGKNPCQFCDYPTVRGLKSTGEYMQKLNQELRLRLENMDEGNMPMGIAIGGGTPSMLPPEHIKQIGEMLNNYFPGYKGKIQLSFEVNPLTAKEDVLEAFKEIGASRASIGIQSFGDSLMQYFWRRIKTDRSIQGTKDLMQLWPDTTNVDLMYGLPGQTFDEWESDLEKAIELKVPSITVYNLRRSNRTSFKGTEDFPPLYQNMIMQSMAMIKLREEGYQQIADNQFVKTDKPPSFDYRDAKRMGLNLIAVGLGAYSFLNGSVKSDGSFQKGVVFFNYGGLTPHKEGIFEQYITAVKEGELPIENGRIMDLGDQMSLYAIQGLKSSALDKPNSGINMKLFEKRFGKGSIKAFTKTINNLLSLKLMEVSGDYLKLTPLGLSYETPILTQFYQRN